MEAEGFTVDKISLDRTPDGYIALRSVIWEERIDMIDSNLLQNELIHLQFDSITSKVDHPVGGSKDVADSYAGWVWNALKNNPGIIIPTKSKISAIKAVNGGTSSKGSRLPSMFPNIKIQK